MVEGVGCGDGADEDKHDEAHALLAVVGAVEETDSGAGEHHQDADGPRRRLLALGRLIEGWVFDEPLGDQYQKRGGAKAQYWRDEQNLEDLDDLLPIEAGGADMWVEELVGHAYADDGADHGVGAGGRQTEPPGTKIPQNGGNEQRKDHGEACAGADLQDEFDRQQRDHRKGHRAAGG